MVLRAVAEPPDGTDEIALVRQAGNRREEQLVREDGCRGGHNGDDAFVHLCALVSPVRVYQNNNPLSHSR